ncbi:MAG: PilN domain-containing protein [Gammaproteobacteria bacterium]
MARINLLPWRDELRKQKKQDFIFAIALSMLGTIGILIGVHFYIEGLKEYQEARNKKLQAEIVLLDKKIAEIKTIEEKKNKLLEKINVIQKLQESRPEIVHLFDEIPKTTPDGIFLTKFSQVGELLTFEGKTESNARVSAFMRAIDASQWLNSPKINVIQSRAKTNSSHSSDFTMIAKQGKKAEEVKQ